MNLPQRGLDEHGGAEGEGVIKVREPGRARLGSWTTYAYIVSLSSSRCRKVSPKRRESHLPHGGFVIWYHLFI